MIRTALLVLAASIAAAGIALAQEVKPPARLVATGKLTYGVAATFAPFQFQRDGKLVGVDVDFGEEIAWPIGCPSA